MQKNDSTVIIVQTNSFIHSVALSENIMAIQENNSATCIMGFFPSMTRRVNELDEKIAISFCYFGQLLQETLLSRDYVAGAEYVKNTWTTNSVSVKSENTLKMVSCKPIRNEKKIH